MKRKAYGIVFLLTILLSLTCCGNQEQTKSDTKTTERSVLETETAALSSISETTISKARTTAVTTTVITTETTTVTTTVQEEICSEMQSVLEDSDYTVQDLDGSQQLIAAISDGYTCHVYGFEKEENSWNNVFTTDGFVGKNGVSPDSCEGDYHTPQGLFPSGFAFGTEPMENLSVEYRLINENCYWVDDPDSEYYNMWCETTDITWNSAEHLIDYPSAYHYAVVIDFNMEPIVPNKGSAIFLHCSTGGYTAGCISVPENVMYDILHWLDDEKEPMIMIV